MSNSSLVVHTNISPNRTSPRNRAIDRISIHCVVGQCSVETLGSVFKPSSRQASSNYGIGTDGRVGMYCEEKDRSWCTSSGANDHRAVTIEVASDTFHPYAVKDKAFAALLDLCTDICKRNGKSKLLWFGDKDKTLAYTPKAGEMVLTVHRWFANKSCPGDYLYNRHGEIAAEVTKRLGGTTSQPSIPAPSGALKVGDIVDFKGVVHYANANAASGPSCKPGKAKVTRIYPSGKHPYHLIAEKGGGSNVYGWVNTSDIAGASAPTTATPAIVKGSKVKLKNGATYYGGQAIPRWVLADTWIVKEIKGDRAVIDKNVSGRNSICSPVNVKNLILV